MNTAGFTRHARHALGRRRTATAIAAVAMLTVPAAASQNDHERVSVIQTNLVANRNGYDAAIVDANLVNPWGLSKFPTAPVWISDNHGDVSTLYAGGTPDAPGDVKIRPLVVSVPGGPTGQIANSTTGFKVSNGSPALFVFASEDGQLRGWNPALGTNAEGVAAVDGAIYKGLAQGSANGANYLFAANFGQGRVDVFDENWQLQTWPDAFSVPRLPKGFSPFNVQVLRDSAGEDHLFVAYALRNPATNDEVAGRRLGLVAEFTTAGEFVRRFERDGMNAPWGLAYAPENWGDHAGDLLVGQFGNGRIEMYDPDDGDHEGTVRDDSGHRLVIDGLWGLLPADASSGGEGNLLFTAGPNGEADGIYGVLSASQAD